MLKTLTHDIANYYSPHYVNVLVEPMISITHTWFNACHFYFLRTLHGAYTVSTSIFLRFMSIKVSFKSVFVLMLMKDELNIRQCQHKMEFAQAVCYTLFNINLVHDLWLSHYVYNTCKRWTEFSTGIHTLNRGKKQVCRNKTWALSVF